MIFAGDVYLVIHFTCVYLVIHFLVYNHGNSSEINTPGCMSINKFTIHQHIPKFDLRRITGRGLDSSHLFVVARWTSSSASEWVVANRSAYYL